MRTRRRRRTWPANLLCLVLGVLIGALLTRLLWPEPTPVNGELPSFTSSQSTSQAPALTLEEPEPYNDPTIPDAVEEAAVYAGELYGIAPELLEAIAWHESRFQPDAVNGDCTGLMQVSLYWHTDRMDRLGVTEADMWSAGPNMLVAADFLAELFRIYDGDLGAVLMYYNGDSRLDEYLETGFLSNYALNVMELAEALEAAHNAEEVVPMSAQK